MFGVYNLPVHNILWDEREGVCVCALFAIMVKVQVPDCLGPQNNSDVQAAWWIMGSLLSSLPLGSCTKFLQIRIKLNFLKFVALLDTSSHQWSLSLYVAKSHQLSLKNNGLWLLCHSMCERTLIVLVWEMCLECL